MKSLSTTALLIGSLGFAGSASAVAFWDGGGDGITWSDPTNWVGDALPGPTDLVFINGAATSQVNLASDQAIDALRFADGANLAQTAGTLTVGPDGPDTESSFPEFGPNPGNYAMSGTAAYRQTDGGRLILGRAGDGTLNMSGDASMSNTGEIWFGMDRRFNGTLSGNASVSASNMQMARFASLDSQLTLTDNSSLNTGFFVMSDDANLSGDSTLQLQGSDVTMNVGGLFAREGATLNFLADPNGVSAINLSGPADLFDNGGGLNPQLVVDLSAYTANGPVTLINNTSGGVVNGMFRGLGEGVVVPGSGGRTITYLGGDGNDVVLLPEPAALTVLALGGMACLRRRSA